MCITCIEEVRNSAEGSRKYALAFKPGLDNLLQSYWKRAKAFEPEIIKKSFEQLLKTAIEELGWGTEDVMSGQHLRRFKAMQRSLAEFALKKNYSFSQMAQALKSEGLDKATFIAELAQAHEVYYNWWQEVEAQQVRVVSVAKRNWERIEEYGEVLPYITYNTLGDDRVRPEHKALDGLTLRYDHPFWQNNTPPNGYNCRCFITQDFEGKISTLTQEQESFEPDKGFEKNFAQTNDFFPKNHNYLQLKLEENKEYQTLLKELLNE